jgi:hypothetical protein
MKEMQLGQDQNFASLQRIILYERIKNQLNSGCDLRIIYSHEAADHQRFQLLYQDLR